jgi:O-antigen/teichoic acid export membrane protein
MKKSDPKHARRVEGALTDDRSSRRELILLPVLSVLGYGAGAVTGPILAQSLGATGRGHLAAALAPYGVIGGLMKFGLEVASAAKTKQFGRVSVMQAVWLWVLGIVTPICAAVFWIAPRLLENHPSSTVVAFRILLVIVPFYVASEAAMEIELVERGATYRMLTTQFGGLFGNAFLVVLLAVIGQLTLRNALIAGVFGQLMIMASAILLLKMVVLPRRRSPALKPLLKYGGATAIGSMSYVIVGRLDQFIMAMRPSARDLGVYAVAANVVIISGAVSNAFSRWAFAKAQSRDDRALVFAKMTKLVSGVSLVMALGLALTGWLLIPAFFGAEFRSSVAPMLVLLPGQVCIDTASVLCSSLNAKSRPMLASLSRLSGTVVSLVFLFPAIVRYSYMGAASVTAVSGVVTLIVAWRLNRRTGWDLAPAPADERTGRDAGSDDDPSGFQRADDSGDGPPSIRSKPRRSEPAGSAAAGA